MQSLSNDNTLASGGGVVTETGLGQSLDLIDKVTVTIRLATATTTTTQLCQAASLQNVYYRNV